MKYDELFKLLSGGNAMIDSMLFVAGGDNTAQEERNKVAEKTFNERGHLIGSLREMWLYNKFVQKKGLTQEFYDFQNKHMTVLKKKYDKTNKD